MSEREQPLWYGNHDNPHHAGPTSHRKRIRTCEDDLLESTGVKGSRAKFLNLSKGELSELLEGIEPLSSVYKTPALPLSYSSDTL